MAAGEAIQRNTTRLQGKLFIGIVRGLRGGDMQRSSSYKGELLKGIVQGCRGLLLRAVIQGCRGELYKGRNGIRLQGQAIQRNSTRLLGRARQRNSTRLQGRLISRNSTRLQGRPIQRTVQGCRGDLLKGIFEAAGVSELCEGKGQGCRGEIGKGIVPGNTVVVLK